MARAGQIQKGQRRCRSNDRRFQIWVHSEALAYAHAHGLIVRAVHEVDDELILRCLEGIQVAYHRVAWKDVSTHIIFQPEPSDGENSEIVLAPATLECLASNRPFARDKDDTVGIEELFQKC